MFGNESKTQAEILKNEPYAEFLRQFDIGGETVHIRIASDNIARNEDKLIGGFYINQNIVFDYLFISSHKPV